MLKRVLTLSLTAVLTATGALAAGPESTDAEGLQTAVTDAQSTLSALKNKFQGVPGISYQGEAVVVDVGATANAYDKEILEKQLPRIEEYLVNAGQKLGAASLKLPGSEGVTIFYQGCAETLKAQRQVTVALGKAKYSINFKADDFSSVLADIEDALSVSKCR